MSSDYRERVVAQALKYRRSATTSVQRRADKSFDTHLQVDGFRHASRAPVMHLQKETVYAFSYHIDVATAVLDLWMESQSELEAACRRFLSETETQVKEIFEMNDRRVYGWSVGMKEVLSAFMAKHSQENEADATLMLCCLVGESWTQVEEQDLDVEREEEFRDVEDTTHEAAEQPEGHSDAESEPLHVTMWQQWLDVLAALPPAAPEWETASEFIFAVQQLAKDKRSQTEYQTRANLRSTLARLLNESTEALAYFGFEDCSAWSAEACSASEAVALTNRITEMHSALDRYTQLRAQPAPTLAEDKARLSILSDLQEEISQLHEQLATVLIPSDLERALEDKTQSHKPLGQSNNVTLAHPKSSIDDSLLTRELGMSSVSEGAVQAEPISEGATLFDKPEDTFADSAINSDIDATHDGQPLSPFVSTIAEAQSENNHGVLESDVVLLPNPPRPEDSSEQQFSMYASDLTYNHAESSSQSLEESNWNELLWKFIEEGDVPAAYWLSRSLAAANLSCESPAWLLAALQGAEWLSPESYTLTQDLAEIVRGHQLDEGTPHLEALGVATGLRPSLIAPDTGLQEWLKRTNHSAALNKLTVAVREFANLGKPLRFEAQSTEPDGQHTAGAEIAKEAEKWLVEASMRRAKNKGATDVWRKMVTSGGDVWELLAPVSENRRQAEAQVWQKLSQLENSAFVSQRIDEVHLETVHGRKVQPIEGVPRQQLMRDAQEACSLARRWCASIERERETSVRGDWLTTQITRLRSAALETLPVAETELQELYASHQQKTDSSSVIQCLRRSIRLLQQTLHLPTTLSDTEIPNTNQIYPLKDEPLLATLSRRLFWLPELTLEDDGQPVLDDRLSIARALQNADTQNRTLETSADMWMHKQDYRFIALISDVLSVKTDNKDTIGRYKAALESSRVALSEAVAQTLETVEQGVVDGIIADSQRAEYSAEIEAIEINEVLNFHAVNVRLEAVKQELAEARKRRLTDLSTKWQQLKPLFVQRVGKDRHEHVCAFVEESFSRSDTRVVDECLARLGGMLESGSQFEDNWFTPTAKRDVLSEFLCIASGIEAWLQSNSEAILSLPKIIEDNGIIGTWKLGDLLPTRRREVDDAVRAWTELKKRGARSKETGPYLTVILRYLGFTFVGSEPAVKVERREADWLYARATVSASDLAKPIPQFGSLANSGYDIVCLWERPSADTVGARLHEARLNGRSLLVFYLGQLSNRERINVARLARERELTLAVLDDVLLTFLAGEKDARLRAFLPCALPYSALNPYTPFQAGDVPPEMFFGREAMARELRRPQGSCLVYGGRQLGKSALLRHVQREFNQPKQEQYALVEDIKMVGDSQSGQPTDAIWRKIREGFVRLGLMKRTTDKPDEIRRSVRQAMMQPQRRFVLMMFDEADNFLDADAADGFRVVTELRTLMMATDRRFKVVFAGLQNVQRFQGIPNQPLAHFGRPIPVGPLEPKAAQELVREPFEALGYRFTDDATVLRILSYTNYHAGLIQLFCQELLVRLHARLDNTAPPYFIEQTDVEGVYRTRQVRESIRERFDWTLALNARYQAIAWAMIADQMSDHDSYARAYSASRIQQLANYWWEQGFSGVGSDQLHGLLDEMCGLGVLVRDAKGHYRLRSPNLVRLMGTEADIGNRLVELSQKPPEIKYDADSHHAQLGESSQKYSPLTYSQERALNPPQFGVGLVFASNALGLAQLEDAVKGFIPVDLPAEVQAEFAVIPSEIEDATGIEKWLRSFLENRAKHERLIVFQKISGSALSMAERVRETLRFCRARRSQKQWLRVTFAFDSHATWQWMMLPLETRSELEEQSDSATSTRRWNLLGVRQRLARANKMHSDEVCQEVLRVTGGWLWLLDVLLNRCQQDDPRGCAHSMEHELADTNSELAQQWRHVLMFNDNLTPSRILRFIGEEQGEDGVPCELIVPELLGGEPNLSKVECDAAVDYLQRMGFVDALDESLRVEMVARRALLVGD